MKIRKYSIAWFVHNYGKEIICVLLAIAIIPACMHIGEKKTDSYKAYEKAHIETIAFAEELEEDTPFCEVEEAIHFNNEWEEMIYFQAIVYEVDPILAIAISRLETGNFKSKAFTKYNNFGGLTGKDGVKSYESKEAGLDAFMKCLSWYKSKGMDSAEKMAKTYCPPNADNWKKSVKAIMEEY